MKNLMLLIISAGFLTGCGLSYCRENMCGSCQTAEEAPAPVKKEEPKKPVEQPKPKPVEQPKPVATPTVVIDNEDEAITLGATTFKYNAYDFTDEAKANLDVLANYMKLHKKSTITVEGHTDSIGSAAANQDISEKRANAVKNYLVDSGIDEKRITTKGYGKTKPIATNKTREGRAKNRRIEIVFNNSKAAAQKAAAAKKAATAAQKTAAQKTAVK